MTEEAARAWIATHFGSAGVVRMERLAAAIHREAPRQNLVAASTLPLIWSRHIVDSAQLISLAPEHEGRWIDIGSGAGFPGLVVGALTKRRTLLVEPRRRRAEFLREMADVLGASRTEVVQATIERVKLPAAVISARAVAPLDQILTLAVSCAERDTVWLLPKGGKAEEEVENAERAWQGVFHVEQSLTDPNSQIVVATGVARR